MIDIPKNVCNVFGFPMSVDEKIVNQPYHIFRLKRRGIWKVKDIFCPVWNVALLFGVLQSKPPGNIFLAVKILVKKIKV